MLLCISGNIELIEEGLSKIMLVVIMEKRNYIVIFIYALSFIPNNFFPILPNNPSRMTACVGCVVVCWGLPARCMGDPHPLAVGVLSPIVINVIKGTEVTGSIRMEALHDLICNATHLNEEEKRRR